MNGEYTNLKLDLIDEIKQMRPHHRRGNNQFSIRCPMCGDSRKHKSSTHFYLKIDPYDDKQPVLCHCFLCQAGGLLNATMLKHMEITDLDIGSGITSLNASVISTNTTYKNYNKKRDYFVPPAFEDASDQRKKEYIEKRLGRAFSYKELQELKTVFSLGDFIAENNIESLSVNNQKADILNKNYVGFLTMNNDIINFRQVIPTKKYHRYEKYTIDYSGGGTLKFYTIPTTVDILQDKTLIINIAEGVFDILGIYYHIDGGGRPNSVYSAVTGSDFRSVIDYYIREGFVGDVIINIYSDSEVPEYAYTRLVRSYGVWVKEINLIYNTKAEDFGVPKDQIDCSVTNLLG